VLAKDARVLAALREGVDAGQHPSALFQQNGVWQKRQGLFQAALKHTSPAIAQQIIQECLAADSAIKGQSLESADDVLLRLCLLMAGRPLFTAALS
jgi:DNA polymerase-3 subunit delta